MPRDLRPLPSSQVRIELVPKFSHLLSNSLKFCFGGWAVGEMPQLLDILLQTIDLALPVTRFVNHS